MNDTDLEQGLREHFRLFALADSDHATKLVISSLRARRGAPLGSRREPQRRRTSTHETRVRPSTLAGIAAALTVALVAGFGFAVWRTGLNGGLPGGAASPSATGSAIGSTTSASATPTAQPSPTLRVATRLKPAHEFSPTASMNGRYTTATLLQDGRVLMTGDYTRTTVGGLTVAIYSRSAELYDPATDTFTPTGSMVEARAGASVTALRDGRVLFAGGMNFASDGGQLVSTQFATAELYDPKTGQFSFAGSMSHARYDHAAALLADGEVLIAGGGGTQESGLDGTAELYEPKTGTFRTTGSMVMPRTQSTATPLMDGRVLITGGLQIGSQEAAAQAELYDPATGRFSPTGSMTTVRSGATVTLLRNGKVLIAGGAPSTGPLATAESYDPKTGQFSPTGSMIASRDGHTAALLYDGRVLIAGGWTSDGVGDVGQNLARTRPDGAKTSLATSASCQRVAAGRRLSTAAGYDSPLSASSVGSAILGAVAPSTQLTSVELYDPETGTFSSTGSMGTMRTLPTTTALLDGRVLFAGGDSPDGTSAELYQP
jgi:nitrate reductase NapE component